MDTTVVTLHYLLWSKQKFQICPVVANSLSTWSMSEIERSSRSAFSSEKTCHRWQPIISRPKWMSGLSPQWTPSFKSPHWRSSSVQSADCYCQICKGATQDKWLHSIIMSQSTFRVQDKAITPLKVLKKKTTHCHPNPPAITSADLNIIHFQREMRTARDNTKSILSWEAQVALLSCPPSPLALYY